MKVQAANSEASMVEKIRELRKEFNVAMSSFEEPLDALPNKADYVEKVEFRIYTEKFKELRNEVERCTDVLLRGFQTEANHVLNSKVSRTEVEDLIADQLKILKTDQQAIENAF